MENSLLMFTNSCRQCNNYIHSVLISCCRSQKRGSTFLPREDDEKTASGRSDINRSQAWATSGPWATPGPRSTLMWPVTYICSFLDSFFRIENMLKIQKISNFSKIYLKSYYFYAFNTSSN
jgi:hypothetical protein